MQLQSGQAKQVSAAIEEMSATVMEVARKSSEASGTADQAGRRALEGGNVVRKLAERTTRATRR